MLDASCTLQQILRENGLELARGPVDGGADQVMIVDAVVDSRDVRRGALFFCVRGENSDGHDFAEAAVAAGAAVLVVERELDLDIAQVMVPEVRQAVGPISATVWGHPDQAVAVVGVTGTNGKTTIVSMLEQLGEQLGTPIRSMGTLTGQRTTPEATEIYRFIAQARRDGVVAVAIEVSSHALILGRVNGVEFRLAIFTNLGQDHLDFHGDVESYFAAKALLFTPAFSDHILVNVDDPHGTRLLGVRQGSTTTYSINDLGRVTVGRLGSTFVWRGHDVSSSVLGRHNVSNLLAVLEAAHALGMPDQAVARAASGLRGAPGRFEVVPPADEVVVVVDYAHSPDGLDAVLRSAREVTESGELWVVFGCGGDRDRLKRPVMGEVAATLADHVVLTTDNPRSEDPASILAEIEAGFRSVDGAATLAVEMDRFNAIDMAVARARVGDVIVVAGKGHESTQTFADRVVPFEDRVAVAQSLRHRSLAEAQERAPRTGDAPSPDGDPNSASGQPT